MVFLPNGIDIFLDVFQDEFHHLALGEGNAVQNGFYLIEIIFKRLLADNVTILESFDFLVNGDGIGRRGQIPQGRGVDMVGGKPGGEDGPDAGRRFETKRPKRLFRGHLDEGKPETDSSRRARGVKRIEGFGARGFVHSHSVVPDRQFEKVLVLVFPDRHLDHRSVGVDGIFHEI